jgi:peroxiredoxin
MRTLVCLILAVAWISGGATAMGQGVTPGKEAPAFELPDINGAAVSLATYKDKYVVLEWTNYDCPFVRKHYETGRMPALQKKLADEGVVWLSICSSAPGKQGHLTKEQWAERMKAVQAAPKAVLLDADGKVGTLYGARNTPQMVVIDPAGVVIYAGAIDDQPGLDRAIMDKAVNYVTQALAEARAGKPVTVATTAPYGCSVKY